MSRFIELEFYGPIFVDADEIIAFVEVGSEGDKYVKFWLRGINDEFKCKMSLSKFLELTDF